jgi:hypothetical protein
MTKIAEHDKRFGKKDQRTNEYFESDYIYIKNCWTRFFVFVGCAFIIACRWLYALYGAGGDVFTLDIKKELVGDAAFTGVALVIYTVISSKIAFTEYNEVMNRVKHYYAMLARLGRAKDIGEEDAKDGRTAGISRNADRFL